MDTQRNSYEMSRERRIVQLRRAGECAGVVVVAVKQAITGLVVSQMLIGHIERYRARKIHAGTDREIGTVGRLRHLVGQRFILQHRRRIAVSGPQREDRQRTNLDTGPQVIRCAEISFEVGFVLRRAEIGAVGHVLHPHTVVPVAFVIHRHDGEPIERVRSAEH